MSKPTWVCPACCTNIDDEVAEAYNWEDCVCPGCGLTVALEWDEQLSEDGYDSWAYVIGILGTRDRP